MRRWVGDVAGSAIRNACAPTPDSATKTPKNTTKNCGWARKLLRQQTKATAAVTAMTTVGIARGPRRIWRGSRPSGNSRPAQM